ncbi:MAG: M24 family metallopeptidase [Isosphaeraceae bacterium]|nr:M24 family metallopeptidase [Isosphaeraceae bacterium]
MHPAYVTLPPLEEADSSIEVPVDRVLHTAGDRPNTITLPALADPAADHLDEAVRRRREDVEEKQRRVAAFLTENHLDAVVLGRADSVAWFTAGGDLAQMMSGEASAALLYINHHSRAVITDNVHSARLFEEELSGLGFQLKERPWYDDPAQVVAELAHNRRIATDCGLAPWPDVREPLRALRFPLTKRERQHLRELGRTLTLAVEATCRNFQPGETEADIAGHLAHRLMREGVVPVDLRVAADDRPARYRQPTFKAAEIRKRATISAVGRRHGLCAAVSRTVAFGAVEKEVREAHALAAMVDATFIYFSRPGESVTEVFRRARRIYEKYGHPDEWTLAYQGFLIGYAPREAMLRPDGNGTLVADSALCWSPSVGPARSEDTIVIDRRGYEVVTEAQRWPKLEVTVKGFLMQRPGILER